MVEFPDTKRAMEWLDASTPQTKVCFASRSALRQFPFFIGVTWSNNPMPILPVARALLLSVVTARYPTPRLNNAVRSAMQGVKHWDRGFPSSFATNAGTSALVSAVFPHTAQLKDGPAHGIFGPPAFAQLCAQGIGNSAEERRAATADADFLEGNYTQADIFANRLWPNAQPPQKATEKLQEMRSYWASDQEIWGFWKRWYEGFLLGNPLGWEIQLVVAELPDADWEKGPEWIARKIAEIENKQNAKTKGDSRQRDFEPTEIEHVLRNPLVFSYQTSTIAHEISASIEAFHSETGLNQLPEVFAALPHISRSFTTISTILRPLAATDKAERTLREEIGRLNARIAQLEADLAAATKANASILPEDKREKASNSLGSLKLYATVYGGIATLVGSLWVVSGDEIGPEKRLEMLSSYCNALFGWCEEGEAVEPILPHDPTVET